MEEQKSYSVKITPEAESYYIEAVKYFYDNCSPKRAKKKADDLMDLVIGLELIPHRGRIEENLRSLGKNHRYVLYNYTKKETIKVIYFIEEEL